MIRFFFSFCPMFFAVCFLIVFDFASASQQDTKEILRTLLASRHRPTMQKVVDAFGGKIPRSALREIPYAPDEWAEKINLYLPKAIAKLEYLYPGAIWASLGRDSADIADLLEAFYMGFGLPGRAVRINASTGTFNSGSDSMFVPMLKMLGMRIDRSRVMRPFIVIDRTSYRSSMDGLLGSQSTRLMNYVYSYYTEKTKRPIQTLFEKVAVISTDGGEEVRSRKKFFKDLAAASVNSSYPPLVAFVDELSPFTDQTPWHETFDRLVYYADGTIGGKVGVAYPTAHRKAVLSTMIVGYQTVTTKKFQDAVRKEARKLRYDFDERLKMYAKSRELAEGTVEEPHTEALVAAPIDRFFKVSEKMPGHLDELVTEIKDIYSRKIVQAVDEVEENGELSAEIRQVMVNNYLRDLKRRIADSTFKSMTPFEHLMLAYLKSFSKYEPYENQYFSENASVINVAFDKVIDYGNDNEYILSYLKLLVVALNDGAISSKDYRRLILYAFSRINKDQADEFYRGMVNVVKESPTLESYLVKHAEVYLTSKKNGGAAKSVYKELIERKILPKSAVCEELLLPKEGEEDAA